MGRLFDLISEYQQAKAATIAAWDVAANNPDCATAIPQCDKYAAEEDLKLQECVTEFMHAEPAIRSEGIARFYLQSQPEEIKRRYKGV